MIAGTSLLMLTAAAVDPRLPYEPASPFPDFYLPLFSRGLFSINWRPAFEGSAIFDGAGAFNLGRAMGLPRGFEMLPLGLCWAAAVFVLFGAPSRVGRAARGITAVLIVAWVSLPGILRLASATPREPGLCRAVSVDQMWPYFSDHALQGEPSPNARRHRVPSPLIVLAGQGEASDLPASASVAVTFSGYINVPHAGWHVLRLETIGQAVVYVDGTTRLRIEGRAHGPRAEAALLYLSPDDHELIVRFMSDRPLRSLKLEIAREGGPFAPLAQGLFSGACRP